MDKRYLVLGGWGISPDILYTVFGADAIYIDSNQLIPSLIKNGILQTSWPSEIKKQLSPHLTSEVILAGWSTGAMLAYGLASVCSLQALVLLSATPSFCRTATFKSSYRPSLLLAMKKRLRSDPQGVLSDFRHRCGLNPAPTAPIPWTPSTLSDGLSFLEQATLFNYPHPSCPVMFFHGTTDVIVPPAAAMFFSNHCTAPLELLDGPHTFFTSNRTTLQSLINSFVKGTQS